MTVLRIVVFAIGVVFLCVAAWDVAAGGPWQAFGWLAVLGLIFTLGAIYEQVRYKTIDKTKPDANWTETSERFIDNETGNTVTVYYNPATGERRYVTKKP